MPPDLIARVEALHADHPSLRGLPATDAQIAEAQQTLGVVFDPQYVAFIKRFGGSFAGVSIHAFANGSMIGRETVTELTQWLRDGHGEVLQDELRDAVVISGDGAGNPVLLTAQGEVLLYLHDEGEVERLFPSLYDMMDAWLA
ncbi:MAG TPA: cell wall assembly protein [Stenotrophomonas sp.]|nr:cell wall assembly protein [Stenotrophomonas sp.]